MENQAVAKLLTLAVVDATKMNIHLAETLTERFQMPFARGNCTGHNQSQTKEDLKGDGYLCWKANAFFRSINHAVPLFCQEVRTINVLEEVSRQTNDTRIEQISWLIEIKPSVCHALKQFARLQK